MKVRIMLLCVMVVMLPACSRLASIPFQPEQTPKSWLEIQPFTTVAIGATSFILVQPSSTALVYLLGIVTVIAGIYILRIQGSQQARRWWGIALLLWGLGASSAGTSYQAFSYEIKCAGKQICSWTSWWEIAYLLLSVASIDAMVVAGAYSGLTGKPRELAVRYATVNFVAYVAAIVIGVISLNRFLISFEMLLVFAAPNVLLLFVLNGRRFLQFRDAMDLALLVAWLWLGVTIGVYFAYWAFEVTDDLWHQGIWFSENDVLHIGLIGWMSYIALNVAPRIVDLGALDELPDSPPLP
jgi:hypothetical protein